MKDLTGKKFGKLTVISYAFSKDGKRFWKCKCDCGNEIFVYTARLTIGEKTNCGCDFYRTQTKHNLYKSRIYKIFTSMKQRCYNPKNPEYKNYGLRNIKICDEWLNDRLKFINWAYKNGYKDNLTIERINVNGNYCPENCKWIKKEDQLKNTTRTKYITINGETHYLSEWIRISGISNSCYHARKHKGYNDEEAIWGKNVSNLDRRQL